MTKNEFRENPELIRRMGELLADATMRQALDCLRGEAIPAHAGNLDRDSAADLFHEHNGYARCLRDLAALATPAVPPKQVSGRRLTPPFEARE